MEVTVNSRTSAAPNGVNPATAAAATAAPSTEPMDLTPDAKPAPALAPGASRTSTSTSERGSITPSLGEPVGGLTGSVTAARTSPITSQPLPNHGQTLAGSDLKPGAGPAASNPTTNGHSPIPPASNGLRPSIPRQPSATSPQPKRPYTLQNISSGAYGFPLAEDSPLTLEEMVEQCNNAFAVFEKTSGSALRRLVRDHWQKCLADSESHLSFVLNAVMDRASPTSSRTAADKFGANIVKHAARELVGHLTTDALGELADVIVRKAPDALLDAAMRRRLESISGRSLLNMLARAERLGYDQSDVVEEDEAPQFTNRVIPGVQSPASDIRYPVASVLSPMPAASTPQTDQSNGMTCRLCFRSFPNLPTLRHHVKKRVCTKPPISTKFVCPVCGQSFANKTGLDYHDRNNVCGTGAPSTAAQAGSPVVLSSDGSSRGSPGASAPMQPPPSQAAFKNPVPTHIPSSTPVPSQARTIPSTPTPSTAKLVSPAAASYIKEPSLDQEPYMHLTQKDLDAMKAELKACQAVYDARMDDARREGHTPLQLRQKLDNLKNCCNTKQSGIRKKYGVNLRTKRPRVSAGGEQFRQSGTVSSPSWTNSLARSADANAYPNKKPRVSVGGQAGGQYRSHAPQETPVRKQAGAEVAAPAGGSGLMASAATPEMTDPTKAGAGAGAGTRGVTATRWYSSYLPGPNTVTNGSSTAQTSHQQSTQPMQASGGGVAKPASTSPMKSLLKSSVVELSSDDTDSDSGDSIPAQLPPPPVRANGASLRTAAF